VSTVHRLHAEEFTIYRGYHENKNKKGFSYSLDKKIADWFSLRFSDANLYVPNVTISQYLTASQFYANGQLGSYGQVLTTINQSDIPVISWQNIPTIQYGSSTPDEGGSIDVTFSTIFTAGPNITATFNGNAPVFITIDTVTISSFKGYSWSNNAAFSNAIFQWTAVRY
jgi:hypothetical protein